MRHIAKGHRLFAYIAPHHSSTRNHSVITKSIKSSRNRSKLIFQYYQTLGLTYFQCFVTLSTTCQQRQTHFLRTCVTFIESKRSFHQCLVGGKIAWGMNQFACSALACWDQMTHMWWERRAMTPTWSLTKANWLIIYDPIHPSQPPHWSLFSLSGHTYIMHARTNTLARWRDQRHDDVLSPFSVCALQIVRPQMGFGSVKIFACPPPVQMQTCPSDERILFICLWAVLIRAASKHAILFDLLAH